MNDYAGDITPQEAWDLLVQNPNAVLVDVRTEAEWRFVGVPDTPEGAKPPVFVEWVTYPDGARNPAFLDQLAEAGLTAGNDAPVVFLCRSGQRSIGAAIAATAAGLGPAYNVRRALRVAPTPWVTVAWWAGRRRACRGTRTDLYFGGASVR